MFSFGKRAPRSALPPALQGSALLTTGLHGAIRSQYIIAGMTAFGMILGAVLAAWLVGFVPSAWDAVTFSAPGDRTVSVLAWLSRGVGVLMGAILGSCFFRHVTYTVVAKSLLTLKDHPEATEAERAWLIFELASMAKTLKTSDWRSTNSGAFAGCALIWVGISFFALTALTTFTAEIWLMSARLFVFFLVFLAGWTIIYSAPASMKDLDADAAGKFVALHLGSEASPSPVLAHAKPIDESIFWLLGLMVVAIVLGGATRGFNEDLQTKAQDAAFSAQLVKLSAKLEETQDVQRKEVLDSLGASQYVGRKTKWALFRTKSEALANATPFGIDHCVDLGITDNTPYVPDGPWLCSVAGATSLDVLKYIFVKQLSPENERLRFLYAPPVPRS